MTYIFSKSLKNLSIALMVIGFLGLAYGFITVPKSVDKLKSMNIEHHDNSGISENELHENKNDGHEKSHDEHLLHQLQNKPWAALYVSAFFFFMISLGTLAFYAIQRAAQAGWSPVLYRVMEGITGYLLPGSIIVFIILVLSSLHLNHLFIWMDPEVVEHDKIIKAKSSYRFK